MIGALPPWVADLGLMAAVFTAVGGAVVMVNRGFHSALTQFDGRVVENLKPVHELIEEIRHEVTYNNGSSLKDITRQNSQEIATLRADVTRAAALAADVAADLAAAHARADAVQGHEEPGAAADAASKTSVD